MLLNCLTFSNSKYQPFINTLVGTNIHGMDNGWRWMARILNMPPRPITPALIQVFLEVSEYLHVFFSAVFV